GNPAKREAFPQPLWITLEPLKGDATGAREAPPLSKSFTKACRIAHTDGSHRNYLFVNGSPERTQHVAAPGSVDVAYISFWSVRIVYPIGRRNALISLRISILA